VARWLQDKVTSLPDPAADIGREDYPTATYSAREVELAFEFFPRRKLDPSSASDGIIAIGPSILWFGQATRRLRSALSQKAGSRYDHRDRPFAVVVSVRDHSCDTYDIINALYGDDAISFRAGDPDSARSISKGQEPSVELCFRADARLVTGIHSGTNCHPVRQSVRGKTVSE
jgi:hypothetical protein